MSEGGRVSFRIDRRLYAELLARAHDEGVSPDEVVEAWIRKALRQDRSIRPAVDGDQDKVRKIR